MRRAADRAGSGPAPRISDRLAFLLFAALFAALLSPDAKADEVKERRSSAAAGPYVLTLQSTLSPPSSGSLRSVEVLRGYRVYSVPFETGGRVWYRLRLGFFASRAEAAGVQRRLAQAYPHAWVTKVTAAERVAAAGALLLPAAAPGGAARAPAAAPVPAAPAPAAAAAGAAVPDAATQAARLMERARRAVAEGSYGVAIQAYTDVLQLPPNPYSQSALEFLGLARERNGQLAHAKAEYQRYLKLYPTGDGADRVRQRLAGLITAREAPPPRLRPATQAADRGAAWDSFGSFSQYYRRDVTDAGSAGPNVNLSMLSTDLDVMARRRSDGLDVTARFTGGYDRDFLDARYNLTRISDAYLAVDDRRHGVAGRIGRQSQSTGGVLGRFDGFSLAYKVTPLLTVNLVGGFPVQINTVDEIATERRFYGFSFDVGTFANGIDVNTYFIQQTVAGMVDRRAVGSELRYAKDNRSLFAMVDYDIYFNKLNTAFAFGNWIFGDGTSVNLTLDLRKSPILTSSNALQGQGVTTVSALRSLYTEEQIKRFAIDRTPDSHTYTLGVTRPINRRLQVSGDLTMTNLGTTPASGGVEAIPGTGNDIYYTVQLIGSSLIKEGDLAIAGLGYSDTSTARTATVTLNTRYPVNHAWLVNPRMRVDLRRYSRDGSDEVVIGPSVRVDYRLGRIGVAELEGGGDWSTLHVTGDTQNTTGYYISAGYRLDF